MLTKLGGQNIIDPNFLSDVSDIGQTPALSLNTSGLEIILHYSVSRFRYSTGNVF